MCLVNQEPLTDDGALTWAGATENLPSGGRNIV